MSDRPPVYNDTSADPESPHMWMPRQQYGQFQQPSQQPFRPTSPQQYGQLQQPSHHQFPSTSPQQYGQLQQPSHQQFPSTSPQQYGQLQQPSHQQFPSTSPQQYDPHQPYAPYIYQGMKQFQHQFGIPPPRQPYFTGLLDSSPIHVAGMSTAISSDDSGLHASGSHKRSSTHSQETETDAASPTKKKNRKGAVNKTWSKQHDDFLIPFLANEAKKGCKPDKQFKMTTFNQAAEQVNNKWGTCYTGENVKNHVKVLRSHYQLMLQAMNLSGAGWDETTKTITMSSSTYMTWSSYLDENKQLILAILDNQNLGRLAECAQYQAQLQKNLLYLAAIADAQPQSPAMRPQMIPHAAMPQAGGSQYMQQPGPVFPPKTPLQFSPQQVQELQQQQLHHQPHMMSFPGHMSMRPIGVFNGSSEAQSEVQRGTTPSSSVDGRGGKEDAGGVVSKNVGDGSLKKSVAEPAIGEAEASGNHKRTEETKIP